MKQHNNQERIFHTSKKTSNPASFASTIAMTVGLIFWCVPWVFWKENTTPSWFRSEPDRIEATQGTGSTYPCKFSSQWRISTEKKIEILTSAEEILVRYEAWFEKISIDRTLEYEQAKEIREWLEKRSDKFESEIKGVYSDILLYDIHEEDDKEFMERFFIIQWKITYSLRKFFRSEKKELYDISSDEHQLRWEVNHVMNHKCLSSLDIESYIPDVIQRMKKMLKRIVMFEEKIVSLWEDVMKIQPITILDYEHTDIVYEFKKLLLEASIVQLYIESSLTKEEKRMFRNIKSMFTMQKESEDEKVRAKIMDIKNVKKRKLFQKIYDFMILKRESKTKNHRFNFLDIDKPRLPYSILMFHQIDPVFQTKEYLERYFFLYKNFKRYRDHIQDIYRGTLVHDVTRIYGDLWIYRYIWNVAKNGYYIDTWGWFVHKKILDTRSVIPSDYKGLLDMYSQQLSPEQMNKPTNLYLVDSENIESKKLIMLWQREEKGRYQGVTYPFIDGIFIFVDSIATRVNELTHILLSRFFGDDLFFYFSEENITPLLKERDPSLKDIPAIDFYDYQEFLSDVWSIQVDREKNIQRILSFAVAQGKWAEVRKWYKFTAEFMMNIISTLPIFQRIDWQKDVTTIQEFIFEELSTKDKDIIVSQYKSLWEKLISQMWPLKEHFQKKLSKIYLRELGKFTNNKRLFKYYADIDLTEILTTLEPKLKKVWKIDFWAFFVIISLENEMKGDLDQVADALLQIYYFSTEDTFPQELKGLISVIKNILGDGIEIDWNTGLDEIMKSITQEDKDMILTSFQEIRTSMMPQVWPVKNFIESQQEKMVRNFMKSFQR